MRKKYLAASLSLCMMLTSCMPLVSNAESMEAAVDPAGSVYEEMLDSEETAEDSDIFMENSEEEETDGVIIDSTEMETSVSAMSVQAGEDTGDQVPTEVSWTELEEQNIKYRYVDTTLYIELIDTSKPQNVVDYSGSSSGPWAINDEENAKKVSHVVIGDGIVTIGNQWFYSASNYYFQNLMEVTLKSSVTKIGDDAFSGDVKLKTINNMENVESIGARAFQNDSALSQIVLTKVSNIGRTAFRRCGALINVSLPEVSTIEESTFDSCSALENISLPKVVTINKNAFSNCTALKYVFLGQANLSVTRYAFRGTSISSVCYQGSKNGWESICATEKNGLKKISLENVHCQEEALAEVKEPTCTETGVENKTCAICKDTYSVEVAALGHTYDESKFETDVEPTCTEPGSRSNHCTRCGVSDPDSAEEISALGHNWEMKVDREATCTEPGSESNHCTRCDVTDPASVKEIPEAGHQWSSWKKTADATVFAAEQQERNCIACGKKETQTVGKKLTATASVSMSSVPLKKKQTTTALKVTGLAKGDSVKSWKSTNTKVFTVKGNADGTCKLTGKKKGSAKLEITLASGLKKTVTVKVQTKTVATKKISGLAKTVTLKKGAKMNLKPVVTPATSQQKVTYKSSNKKIVTVSKSGKIKGVKKGKATITVKSGKVTKKIKVTVR